MTPPPVQRSLVEIRGLAVALFANGDIRKSEFDRLCSLLDHVEELEHLLDQQWRAALNAQAERDQLRALLLKYVEHVSSCEGITFLDRLNEHQASEVEFSAEEVAALRKLEDEMEAIRDERYP